jgi:transposase-like protein
MSKRPFSKDEQLILSASPDVETVTEKCVIFTPEFKEKAYQALLRGERMAAIFEEHGIQPSILGNARINGFREKVQRYAEREEGFSNLRKTKHREVNRGAKPDSMVGRIAFMKNKISYLEQEVEFLKKHVRQI